MPETLAIVADPPEGDPYTTAREVADFTAGRLESWKRSRVVKHAEAADLIMRIRYRREMLPAGHYRVVVEVEVTRAGKPVWSDREERSPIPAAGAGGAHGNAWKRMLPVLLKRFRETMEKGG